MVYLLPNLQFHVFYVVNAMNATLHVCFISHYELFLFYVTFSYAAMCFKPFTSTLYLEFCIYFVSILKKTGGESSKKHKKSTGVKS